MPLKLELPRMSRPDVFLILAPFLPGGMLLGAVVIRNWPLAAKFIYSHFLGYYSKVTVLALAAYTLGWLTMLISEFVSKEFSRQLARWIPKPKQDPANQPWNRLEWRRLARLFIGPKLTPETDFPLDHGRYQHLAATIEQISDPEQKRTQAEQLVQARNALMGSDMQWMNWYFILRNFIINDEALRNESFRNDEALRNESFRQQMVFLFNTCGFAGLVALVLVPDARNWFLWLLFGVAELIGLVFPFALDWTMSTWPAFDNVMSAQMLSFIRKQGGVEEKPTKS